MQKCESLKHVMILRGLREGFHSYEQEMPLQSPVWDKPTGDA